MFNLFFKKKFKFKITVKSIIYYEDNVPFAKTKNDYYNF